MQGLSFTSSAVTFFLVLCLQLGINEGQDNEAVPQPLIFNLNVPSTAKKNEEVSMILNIGTEYKECLVIKAYLKSSVKVEGNFDFEQTRCVCNDHSINLFWDFPVKESFDYVIVVDIVKEKGICPNDVAVVPISGDRYLSRRTMRVV